MTKQDKSPTRSFKADPETDACLEAIMAHHHLDQSKAIRKAIRSLHDAIQVTERPAVAFSGSPETVDAKWKIIEAAAQHKELALSAFEAGVTRATAEDWLSSDPLFAELLQEAWDRSVESAAHKLWHHGVHEGNVRGLSALLDANHPSYGRPRRERMEKEFERNMNRLWPILVNRLSKQDFEAVRQDILRAFGDGIAPGDSEQQQSIPTPLLALPSPTFGEESTSEGGEDEQRAQ